MATKNKILLILAIIILVIAFTPMFGNLYIKFSGPVSYGFFWGPAHPEYIDGFFMSYMFFVTLIVTIFIKQKKYIILGIALGIFLLFDLFSGDIKAFIIDLVTAIVAWIFGQIILLGYKQIRKL